METSGSLLLRKMMVRVLLMGVLVILVRFAYVVTITGESCNRGDFCFFSLPQNLNLVISSSSSGHDDLYTSRDWIQSVRFYSSIFQDLISDGYLSPSRTRCV
ncbi:hypothetical protein Bca52824_006248 [Brassica carinata]|uniref:Uncharacterized protein n=1 Tax=Brassica carinata TaxID=52824 RepID=A0A8X7WUG4_BRACI|nr:hypothetical protein Bca52824_006248 [Brassica carinata]